MIELISNCARGREVYIYLVTQGEKKYIRKTSNSIEGTSILEREAKGWEWYQARRYPSLSPLFRYWKQKEHAILEIEWIDGLKTDITKGLQANAKWVRQAVAHYCEVWPHPREDCTPLHGDFSLDKNIIFNSLGTHVIDWEHFAAEGGPWGFDPLYLLFEALWFGMKGRNDLKAGEKRIILEVLRSLSEEANLTPSLKEAPLKTTTDFIQSHRHFWGDQRQMKNYQLPVLNFSHEQISLIDRFIQNELHGT